MSAEQELLNKIIEKAWSDPAFKKQLLADPKGAIQDSFNITVPDDIEVTAVEESPNKFYLVIPPVPQAKADDGNSVQAMW
ncbi:NHLP leader peptide family RiPP precursor [Paenibacillus solisilvae]|uniref:NHLP leader peptide family RiPP n=1 Tax=Paenibacillus solisilvae TaxID=2486751 RepID=A0ABW0VXV4_9BACL